MSPAETSFTPSPAPVAPPEASTPPAMAPTVLQLPIALRRQLETVVDASYPFESCGVMIGRTGRQTIAVEDVFLGRNLNTERARDRFLLAPEDHLAADRAARQRGLEVVGFWHSHPDHPARPSGTDLETAWEDHSYLIVSTAAFGANSLRSWRLHGGRFLEEEINPARVNPAR